MKKTFFAIIAAVLVLSGCGKDFLEKAPKMSQSDVLTLSTFDGLDLSTAGAYAPLSSTSWYGASFILANEMATGNGKRWGVIYDKYESGRYKDEYSVHYTPNSTSPLWSAAYYAISAANNVINAIEAEGASYDASEQELNNIKAECLFIRALSHFDLVRTYAMPYNYTADHSHPGVPYVYVSDSEAKPARESVGKVYENIIADLLKAEEIIDPNYARAGVNDVKATATLPAIQALLARAYLYSEQWQKAADYATTVINNKSFRLWTAEEIKDGAAYQVDVPGEGEVIFQIYNGLSQTYGTGNETVWGMTSYKGYGDCGVGMDLVNLYEDTDVRKTLYTPDEDGIGMFTLNLMSDGLADIMKQGSGLGYIYVGTNLLGLHELRLRHAVRPLNPRLSRVATVEQEVDLVLDHGQPPLDLGNVSQLEELAERAEPDLREHRPLHHVDRVFDVAPRDAAAMVAHAVNDKARFQPAHFLDQPRKADSDVRRNSRIVPVRLPVHKDLVA